MEIRCPKCQYSRTVPDNTVRPDLTIATCPKCKHRFNFRDSDEDQFILEPPEALDNVDTLSGKPVSVTKTNPDNQSGADAFGVSAGHHPTAQSEETGSDKSGQQTAVPKNTGAEETGSGDNTRADSSYGQQQPQSQTPQSQTPHVQPPLSPQAAPRPRVRPEDLYPEGMRKATLQPREDEEDDRQDFGYRSNNENRNDHDNSSDDDNNAYNRNFGWESETVEHGPERIGTPWSYVKSVGFFPAFATTIKVAMFSPAALFRAMRSDTKFSGPLGFYMLVGVLGAFFETLWSITVGNPILPGEMGAPSGDMQMFLTSMLFAPPMLYFVLYLQSLFIHLILKVTGGGKRGLETTRRVICYATAVDVLAIIPVAGSIIAGLWKLYILAVGLKEAHETTYTRVLPALAVLVLLLLVILLTAMRSAGLSIPL